MNTDADFATIAAGVTLAIGNEIDRTGLKYIWNLFLHPSPSKEKTNERRGIKRSILNEGSSLPLASKEPKLDAADDEKNTNEQVNNKRSNSLYTAGWNILLERKDEETAIELAKLLFHVNLRYLAPALKAFLFKLGISGSKENENLDSGTFLKTMKHDIAFAEVRKHNDNLKLITNALNSRNAVAHHDLAKIFQIWPMIFGGWMDLCRTTLVDHQSADSIQAVLYDLSFNSPCGLSAESVRIVSNRFEMSLDALDSAIILCAIKLNDIQIECALALRGLIVPVEPSSPQRTSLIDYDRYFTPFLKLVKEPNYRSFHNITDYDLQQLHYSSNARNCVQHGNRHQLINRWERIAQSWIHTGRMMQSIRQRELSIHQLSSNSIHIDTYKWEVAFCDFKVEAMQRKLGEIMRTNNSSIIPNHHSMLINCNFINVNFFI